METQEKISALAKYLEVPESHVRPAADYTWDEGNYFDVYDDDETFEGTYLVVDDEKADEMFREDIENVIDDMGTEAFNWDNIGGIEDYVDVDWFDAAMKEDFESYANDIADEDSDDYTSRLLEEMVDRHIVSDEDLIEDKNGKRGFDPNGEIDENDYFDRFVDSFGDEYVTGVEWFIDNFGDEIFSETVNRENLLDVDALVDAIKMNDGRGGSLARYDGYELELDNDLYAYRVD